ncbi:hypothetical protein ACM0CQ_15840 [Mycobacteroides abscessus subsp. abscessus]|uniref:hypothetical protein n=1 Tax=Mycobacteroides abscessus TaxID=36809 RepID=UPI0039EF703F
MPSTRSFVCAAQDLAGDQVSAATIALYGTFTGEYAAETLVPDAPLHLLEEPVTRTARVEVPDTVQVQMRAWVAERWGTIWAHAAALDQLAELEDPLPAPPAAALAHHLAASELAEAAGQTAAGIAWTGWAARAIWLRRYGAVELQLQAMTAADPVLAAAVDGELNEQERRRLNCWVADAWDRIEAAAEDLMGATP